MKYGEQFEKESVPEWSLHNIDYNSLKHYIKVHTTRDQATAIVIPGHPDTALAKFEDELYLELCRQHDRVDLFVSSKADELSRRLQHLSAQIHRLILRCASSSGGHMPLKRQRRFARYERDLAGCGDEIQALSRFVNAQVVAFRKILKKYRKWTGSPALGSRFRDTVLSHPKSFTRRSYSHLRFQYDNLLETLQTATPPATSRSVSPTQRRPGASSTCHNNADGTNGSSVPAFPPGPQEPEVEDQQGYWNEYENGSEAGDVDKQMDGSYAIYIDPNEDTSFPGMTTLIAMFQVPVDKARTWLARGQAQIAPGAEHGPLLAGRTYGYGSAQGSCRGSTPDDSSPTDTEAEEGSRAPSWRRSSYPASDDFPDGYEVHHAAASGTGLPSLDDQRAVARYRARVLTRATLGAFAVSYVLLGLTGVLIAVGRNRMRAEVDAGAAVGAMASLACACAALSMNVTRTGSTLGGMLAVWVAFATVCVMNGVLLVVVLGRTGL